MTVWSTEQGPSGYSGPHPPGCAESTQSDHLGSPPLSPLLHHLFLGNTFPCGKVWQAGSREKNWPQLLGEWLCGKRYG